MATLIHPAMTLDEIERRMYCDPQLFRGAALLHRGEDEIELSCGDQLEELEKEVEQLKADAEKATDEHADEVEALEKARDELQADLLAYTRVGTAAEFAAWRASQSSVPY